MRPITYRLFFIRSKKFVTNQSKIWRLILSDFQRFALNVLKSKTQFLEVLNLRTICVYLQNQSLCFGLTVDKICWSDKEKPVLKKHCKWANYAILERRANLGGTWDFFKYPGIRSDSDMYTFGFSWKIWKSAKPIAPAEDILAYLKEAAEEQGIIKNIHFNTDIQSADWKSSDNRWHLVTTNGHR